MHKRPLPVKIGLDGEDAPLADIEECLACTTLNIPSGPSVGVRAGRCNADPEHLAANVHAVGGNGWCFRVVDVGGRGGGSSRSTWSSPTITCSFTHVEDGWSSSLILFPQPVEVFGK